MNSHGALQVCLSSLNIYGPKRYHLGNMKNVAFIKLEQAFCNQVLGWQTDLQWLLSSFLYQLISV